MFYDFFITTNAGATISGTVGSLEEIDSIRNSHDVQTMQVVAISSDLYLSFAEDAFADAHDEYVPPTDVELPF